jgi:hypothetical protein
VAKFKITPTNNQPPYEVEADRAESEPNSGAVLFYTGDDLVAKLLNVSFYKLPDSE